MNAPELSETAKGFKTGTYRHYKGGMYEALGVARHSETLEELVVYRALYDGGSLWVRPLKMFVEDVEVEGAMRPRFERIENRSTAVPSS